VFEEEGEERGGGKNRYYPYLGLGYNGFILGCPLGQFRCQFTGKVRLSVSASYHNKVEESPTTHQTVTTRTTAAAMTTTTTTTTAAAAAAADDDDVIICIIIIMIMIIMMMAVPTISAICYYG